MESAVNLYNKHSGVQTIDDGLAIIESLKLFVKVKELDDNENEFRASIFKPKILMFIALCNYKIDNINQAYCIANQGLDAIEEAINASVLTGISPNMLGSNTLKEIISIIENNRFDDVEDADNYFTVNATDIDTSHFERITGINLSVNIESNDPLSQEFILPVIAKFDALRMQLMEVAILQNDNAALMSVMMLHDIACSVFYAWEYKEYGHISDFWKEDAAIDAYNKFNLDSLKNLKQQHTLFTNGMFPLKSIDKDGSLQSSMIKILEALIKKRDLPF